MGWVDWAFPFWRATWELWVLVPYHRIKSWWWKRNHPVEYQILKEFVEAYETKIEEQGGLFPNLVTQFDSWMTVQVYGAIGLRNRDPDKRWITDVS